VIQSIRTLTAVLIAVTCIACMTQARPAVAAPDDASKYIQNIGNEALTVIGTKGLSKEQKQAKLEKIFANSVDFQWVGRFVMGRFWRQATDQQKTRYLAEYEKFLLLHYTSRFTDYTSGSFKVTNFRDDGDNEYTVSTQMASAEANNGEPLLVEYRVRKEDRGYRIFDVIVEGVSLLATQRSEFSSVISSKGIDYLIDQLVVKSASGDIRVGSKS